MAHRKVYTPEFKQQAVQLAQQLGNTAQTAGAGALHPGSAG